MARSRQGRIASVLLGALALGGCVAFPDVSVQETIEPLLRSSGLLIPVSGEARDPQVYLAHLADQPLQLHDAIRLTLLNNPEVAREYARLGIAAADVYDATRPLNPQLSLGVFESDIGGDSSKQVFGIVFGLVELLMMPSRARSARSELESTRQEVAAAVLRVVTDTEQAFHQLAAAREIATLHEELLELARVNTPQRSSAGAARLEALESQAALTEARGELGQLMGFHPSVAHWRTPAALFEPSDDDLDFGSLLRDADRRRLDLAAARRRVAQLERALGTSRRYRLLGSIEAGAETERDTDRTRLSGPTVTAEIPLFNHGHGRDARAQAALLAAEAELRALETQIGNRISSAIGKLEIARARIELYREELIPWQESVGASSIAGLDEMIDAQQSRSRMRIGYVQAVRDYWMARCELQRETGAIVLPATTSLEGLAAGGK